MFQKILLLAFISAFTLKAIAENLENDTSSQSLIQFSGLILSSDSLQALPFATAYVQNRKGGTVSDINGFFSLVVQKGDTIKFSYLGFKEKQYIVPKHLTVDRYSVVQLLTSDTLNLAETVIYPWPTKEMFKEAFLKTVIPDDDLARAKKNLKREKLIELGEYLPSDSKELASQHMAQYAKSFYTYGYQPQPNNLLNPIAWAQFLQSWKNGDFKRKD